MLNIPDASMWLAYILCITGAGGCIVYGLINWNKGVESEELQIWEEEKQEDADEAYPRKAVE